MTFLQNGYKFLSSTHPALFPKLLSNPTLHFPVMAILPSAFNTTDYLLVHFLLIYGQFEYESTLGGPPLKCVPLTGHITKTNKPFEHPLKIHILCMAYGIGGRVANVKLRHEDGLRKATLWGHSGLETRNMLTFIQVGSNLRPDWLLWSAYFITSSKGTCDLGRRARFGNLGQNRILGHVRRYLYCLDGAEIDCWYTNI